MGHLLWPLPRKLLNNIFVMENNLNRVLLYWLVVVVTISDNCRLLDLLPSTSLLFTCEVVMFRQNLQVLSNLSENH